MPKRFTDSDKWKDPWFKKLGGVSQLFWLFVLDTCDHAGIWKDQFDDFERISGFKLTEQDKLNFSDRILRIDEESFIVPKFIVFQYPNFNAERNNAHKGVLRSLEYYKLNYSIINEIVLNTRNKRNDVAPSEPLMRGTGIEQNRIEQNRTEQNRTEQYIPDKEQNIEKHFNKEDFFSELNKAMGEA